MCIGKQGNDGEPKSNGLLHKIKVNNPTCNLEYRLKVKRMNTIRDQLKTFFSERHNNVQYYCNPENLNR